MFGEWGCLGVGQGQKAAGLCNPLDFNPRRAPLTPHPVPASAQGLFSSVPGPGTVGPVTAILSDTLLTGRQ